MIVFLPYADFAASARCLDSRRLGMQLVEARQIVSILTSRPSNRPAVLMWRGYVLALMAYADVVHAETRWRGMFYSHTPFAVSGFLYPPWFGDFALHASHRSNLLRKDPGYYGLFGWEEPPTLPYVWPTKKNAQTR